LAKATSRMLRIRNSEIFIKSKEIGEESKVKEKMKMIAM
jgi:hypothetical protein